MLRQSLKQQNLHLAKGAVPFLQDLASHLEARKDGFQTALLFGSQLYCNMALSILSGPTDETNTLILEHLKKSLSKTYDEAINGLAVKALSSSSTRLETQQLLKSMGAELRDISHTAGYIPGDPTQTVASSKVLDIWSLSHQ